MTEKQNNIVIISLKMECKFLLHIDYIQQLFVAITAKQNDG